MQNILKIQINFFAALILLLLSCTAHAKESKESTPQSNKTGTVDSIYDKENKILDLKYIPNKNTIFIDSPKKNIFYELAKIEKNANPELVGAEGDIKFLSNSLIHVEGRNFVAVSYSERSMRGEGTGQCGAGVERYFVSLELVKFSLIQRNKFLIESCRDGIVLVDESKNTKPISLDNGNIFVFKWINYPGYEGRIFGRFDFKENKLFIKNQEENAKSTMPLDNRP
jgi:hypothetical protein